ncbi:MBL fold metallo-hydrolase [Syntrophomonas palmitatica]|uniref:MBL fold metallo-hydrolase n=1 Tax=Syntrophomonas palmitatica TaxID=402877 RepID=UPI0006CF3A6E|nr:MBL fold metallo-hydrolase [Syntrophomonas palmitatica]
MQAVKVIRVPLRLANSYLVQGEKTVIVDAGDPGFSRDILKAMRKNGIRKSQISLIFITHGHIDHYGSVFELKRHIDAPVAIQAIDQTYLESGTQAPLFPLNRAAAFLKAVGQDMKVRKRYGLKADVVINERLNLESFGVAGEIIHTPGHTMGSSSLCLINDTAITGDLIIRRYLFRGPAERVAFLHNQEAFLQSVRTLRERNIKLLYPGHGSPIRMDRVRIPNRPQTTTADRK